MIGFEVGRDGDALDLEVLAQIFVDRLGASGGSLVVFHQPKQDASGQCGADGFVWIPVCPEGFGQVDAGDVEEQDLLLWVFWHPLLLEAVEDGEEGFLVEGFV